MLVISVVVVVVVFFLFSYTHNSSRSRFGRLPQKHWHSHLICINIELSINIARHFVFGISN